MSLNNIIYFYIILYFKQCLYLYSLTSSEKADGRLWYSQFTIASLPYPGKTHDEAFNHFY